MEDITDADYAHAQRVCKSLEIKSLGEYHDLYVQSNKLLLADLFQNFRNMCLEINELGTVRFLTATGISIASSLKNNDLSSLKVKLYLLTDIDVINGRKRY